MSGAHAAFAAELRADAKLLREMADALEARARQHARTGQIRAESVTRFRQEINEEACAFGLRFVGSSLAPTPDYR